MILDRLLTAGRLSSLTKPRRVEQRQAGAIPYAVVEGRAVFLLVTSRRTGRWILPKGSLEKDLAPHELAAKEAWEEAGVVGTVDREPIGVYRTWKTRGMRRRAIEVDMYPLRVERQHDVWDEKGQRYRHWAVLSEARWLLADAQLAALLDRLAARVQPPIEASSIR